MGSSNDHCLGLSIWCIVQCTRRKMKDMVRSQREMRSVPNNYGTSFRAFLPWPVAIISVIFFLPGDSREGWLLLPTAEALVSRQVLGMAKMSQNLCLVSLSSSQYSSSLPPPLVEQNERPRLRRSDSGKARIRDSDRTWEGKRIPDRIRRLSDIMKNEGADQTESKAPKRRRPMAKKDNSRPDSNTKADKIPWNAGYYTSLKSQQRIKRAAASSRALPAVEQATEVLKALLSIPPERCNAANAVCALTLSAKVMGRRTTDEFRSLLFRTTDILSQLLETKSLSARQLCNTAWALAKHYDRDDQILPGPPEQTSMSSDDVAGQAETWDLRHDLAGCPARRVDETVTEIAVQLTDMLQKDLLSAKEGELSMAVWAYGILRRRRRPPGWQQGPQLGGIPVRDRKSAKGSDFIKFEQWGSNNANTVPVECDHLNDDTCVTGLLLDKIGEALCKPLAPGTLVSVSGDGKSRREVTRLRSCKWSELASIAWAYASIGRCRSPFSEALMTAIAREATQRLGENDKEAEQALSRDLSQIVWALGTLQSDNFRLADDLVEFVDAVSAFIGMKEPSALNRRPFEHWSCADIVQVVLALAHARLDERPLLESLYTESVLRLDAVYRRDEPIESTRRSFHAWELSVLLWAQARLYLTSSQAAVFSEFSAKAVTCIRAALQHGSSFDEVGIGPQEQANIAWSLTVLEMHDDLAAKSLLHGIFVAAVSDCQDQGLIQLEHAHQLWQALFLFEGDFSDEVMPVPTWFRDYLASKWHLEKARPKISSARHRSLSKTLQSMGVAHYNEHDEDIDVAIVLKPRASWTHETENTNKNGAKKVAVEFDGPNHFTRQRILSDGSKPEQPRALGHTVLKYRLLKRQGWTVVRVPYFEYDKIPFWASMERQRYLQRLLKTHGNLRFSTVDRSEYKPHVPNRQTRFD